MNGDDPNGKARVPSRASGAAPALARDGTRATPLSPQPCAISHQGAGERDDAARPRHVGPAVTLTPTKVRPGDEPTALRAELDQALGDLEHLRCLVAEHKANGAALCVAEYRAVGLRRRLLAATKRPPTS